VEEQLLAKANEYKGKKIKTLLGSSKGRIASSSLSIGDAYFDRRNNKEINMMAGKWHCIYTVFRWRRTGQK
jgi:hypothetical protein